MTDINGYLFADLGGRMYPVLKDKKTNESFALISATQKRYLKDFTPKERAANQKLFGGTAVKAVKPPVVIPRLTGGVFPQLPTTTGRGKTVTGQGRVPTSWSE